MGLPGGRNQEVKMTERSRRFYIYEWVLIVALAFASVAVISLLVDIFSAGPALNAEYPLKDVNLSPVTMFSGAATLVALCIALPVWAFERLLGK
jgi:hypothetical protein